MLSKVSRRSLLSGAGAAASAAILPAAPVGATPAVNDLLAAAMHPIKPLPELPWRWWISNDGETFHTDEDSRDAILRHAELDGGHIIEARQKWFDLYVDGDDLYSAMEGHNETEIGEGDFISPTDEQLKELADAVNRVISAWADKHKLNEVAWQFGETRNRELVSPPLPGHGCDP